jgi:hypothetical protein
MKRRDHAGCLLNLGVASYHGCDRVGRWRDLSRCCAGSRHSAPRICRGCGRACALVGSEISSRELALLRRSHYRTGGVNLLLRGIGWEDLQSGQFWQASFGRTLAGKLLLVAAILAVSGAPL